MKQSLNFNLFLVLLLTACTSTTATPIVSTVTRIPLQPTLTETATPIPSETPIPPLEKQSATQESVAQFANAMQKAGINITVEQILEQGLLIQTIVGTDGKQYEIASTQDGYPLMIKAEGTWEKFTLRHSSIPTSAYLNIDIPKPIDKVFMENYTATFLNWDIQWAPTEPQEGKVNFDANQTPDINGQLRSRYIHLPKLLKIMDEENLSFIGQSFFWPRFYPDWVKNINPQSKDDIKRIMQNRISALNNEFGDRKGVWIVSNEFAPQNYVDTPNGVPDILLKALGPEYVDMAFEMARDTFPEGNKFITNASLNERRSGSFYPVSKKLGDRLKSKGLIDGLGVQMHLFGDVPISKDELITTMKSYQLPIYITEFDINMKNVKGTQQERLLKQAEMYKTVIDACLESEVCVHIGFMDVGDINSWYVQDGQTNSDPTLFDNNINPKIAYYYVLKSLVEHGAIK